MPLNKNGPEGWKEDKTNEVDYVLGRNEVSKRVFDKIRGSLQDAKLSSLTNVNFLFIDAREEKGFFEFAASGNLSSKTTRWRERGVFTLSLIGLSCRAKPQISLIFLKIVKDFTI